MNAGKPSLNYVLDIYGALGMRTRMHLAKTFSKIDYDILKKVVKKDSLINYWTEKDIKKFGFQEIFAAEHQAGIQLRDLEKKYNDNIVIYYLSEPIYLKNNKTSIFLVSKSKGHRKHIETAVIVMRKENSKWKLIEKIYSEAEFD